ncbi:MAG: penicillin-binding protein 2 [Betaproteobacteria bacterium]|nr:penicillin-binding protein 2 [Betaproteobacteria bacterium]
MSSAANPVLRLRFPIWRSRLLLAILLAWMLALVVRAVYLQGLNNDFLQQKGESRYSRVVEISAHRGRITDRHGEPLAISTAVESVWASPPDFDPSADQLKRLARLLGVEADDIRRRVADQEREFAYLRRQLPPEHAARVVELDIPGVFLQREYRRYYPAGEVTAHLIGITDIDDRGQEGLELAYQDELVGKPGSRRVIKDRLGRIVEDVESIRAPQQGRDLTLSIDLKIQYTAYRELKRALEEHKAKAGGIVVLDARTGEVLAMANLPAYNPNNRGRIDPYRSRNRALIDLFEPGSTLKPFTIAAALEAGRVQPDTIVPTGNGRMMVGKRVISDVHPAGAITVAQVIQKSSNVGAAKIALSLPAQAMWEMFARSGFGRVPDSGFPGEGSGRLRPYQKWKPIEQATMSYGHGISVSLMQLARAYTIFANEGELKSITLLKREEPEAGTQVISPASAHALSKMLELAVQPGGTAPRAQVAGYRVAGKTGTAHKLENGRYAASKYVSSFVGFAPASDPRIIIAVMIDEPSAGQHYGGAVAAPVFREVAAATLRSLSVPPDAPTLNVKLPPADAPLIKEEVWVAHEETGPRG